jgi:antitoxin YefM
MTTLITGIRKTATVKKGGKIEITSPELPSGTKVEVLILVKLPEPDATAYLLSGEANRRHLLQALQDLHNPNSRIPIDINVL